MNKSKLLQFVNFSFFYSRSKKTDRKKKHATALENITFDVYPQTITAIIGPSGCGKSTLLCSINRLHELSNHSSSVEGKLLFHNESIYSDKIDVVKLRKKIGLVFQKPAPFAMSIYDNIAFALKAHGQNNRQKLDVIVKQSLKQVHL